MVEKFFLLFKIPELRRKLLLTLVLLAVYRMGFWIPLPFVDQAAMQESIKAMEEGGDSGFGQVMQIVALFSASKLGNATIFGLGIMPYISASIIFRTCKKSDDSKSTLLFLEFRPSIFANR